MASGNFHVWPNLDLLKILVNPELDTQHTNSLDLSCYSSCAKLFIVSHSLTVWHILRMKI